jgi:DNA polymerase-3 subunit chi
MDTNIVFIVLNSAVKSRIVCDLAEKCYLDNQRIVIYAENVNECKNIDMLLWTWKQQSFIPHMFLDSLSEPHQEPVIITSLIEANADYSTLLLVDPLPLAVVSQFPTVIDFAEKYEAQALESSRERYKIYRDQNFKIETMPPGEFLHTTYS